MSRSFGLASLVAVALVGTATAASQAAEFPTYGALAREGDIVTPADYQDPGYKYGYNSYQGYQPYYYYQYRKPQYRYYRQYRNDDDYYYRPRHQHRFWWRW